MSKIHRSTLVKSTIALACCLVANGCAIDPKTGQPSFKETFASDDPCSNNARNIGILAGTLAGGLIGNKIDKKTGLLVGAGVGALVGGVIGADMDHRKCELSKLAKKYDLELTVTDVTQEIDKGAGQVKTAASAERPVGMSVSITDRTENGHFQTGSDELSPKAKMYFTEIASQYAYRVQLAKLAPNASAEARQAVESIKEKRVLIMGHTDDTGNSYLNADLSERRAKAVARIFRAAGVNEANIYFQGAGETLPLADNRTEEGRAKNRRVEIVDLTDDAAFRSYLMTRPVRTDFYRVTASTKENAPSPNTTLATKTPRRSGPTTRSSADKIEKAPNTARSNRIDSSRTFSADVSIPAPASGGAAVKPVASAVTPSANTPKTRTTQPHNASNAIDFGGSPVGAKPPLLDIGPLVTSRTFLNVISPAQADDLPASRNCADDRPRVSNGVKSLRDSKQYETSEYMPGLYGTSWTGNVNEHLVALTNVAVLRDGGTPAARPQLLIYKDYKGGSPKANYMATPEVNAYKGEKAVLYRVFVNGPVRCMDIVIPNAAPSEAKGSWLYYDADGQAKMAAFNPRIAK